MNNLDVRVRDVFREVFDRDDMEVTDEMGAKDVRGWDSLMQVKLIIALEESFDIKFTTHEVAAMKSVGDLKRFLRAKGLA